VAGRAGSRRVAVVQLVVNGGEFDSQPDSAVISAVVSACPSLTVVIEVCDSEAQNQLPNDECIYDQIMTCALGARSHGTFVSCVADVTDDLERSGLVTGSEKGAIQSCAAKSGKGKK
jgi:hypothetical protein